MSNGGNASLARPQEGTQNVKVKRLLDEGADINATLEDTGQTVMHLMVTDWNKGAADCLLQKGANIDKKDIKGRSPLHIAAATNNVEMTEWLIAHGAALEARTENELQTPLHYAARYGSIEALKILLSSGSKFTLVLNILAL